jgi:molybdopterin-guanine dinucleotide biosynthesis protein A
MLLTGGGSRRMGRDKASIVLGGRPLAVRAATALSAVADPVIEVGPGGSGLDHVREDPPGAGPLAAVAAGAWALREAGHHGPVLVVATDMPGVDEPLLRFLADHPAEESVVPMAGGRDQPLCARYAPGALDTAIDLVESGERSMRALLEAVPVRRVSSAEWGVVAAPEAFEDLDTPDDLTRAEAREWG